MGWRGRSPGRHGACLISSVKITLGEQFPHTNLVQHLVTLIKDKLLDRTKAELLLTDEGVETTWGGDNDVRVSLLVLEELNVLGDGSTTVENGSLDLRHVLAESGVLVLDLVGELTGVAHNKDGGLAIDWLNLLEGRENENCSLTQTRLGLAENVGTQDSLRNADLLDCCFANVRSVLGK